jgi:hypothetical protein
VETVGTIGRSRAAFHIVYITPLVNDDKRALELSHISCIDSEIGLKRHLNLDTRRHIDERSPRPDSGVQSSKLIVVIRDNRAKVFLDNIRMLTAGSISRKMTPGFPTFLMWW